ncbi:bifunctional dihydrofolate reductase-thymidylate synthase-like [Impatiens glandulifera]|uniref:bifunctional dihydrofolate reductase-thymidylate synthase-like n=1 Tax=Impatiens glandulifera TaxID=253017 RepID=UPI001FB194E8|nr:bifunctional dihydrofolate reductase-thymidylate synthase-like [Impatiens glandulifera]XP_047327742.1 bifunctional dihydrofolate reductase-thymidylate synthase-like [Impatiens glandulifera]
MIRNHINRFGSLYHNFPIVKRTYQVVVAATKEMGIGKNGKLPWNLPSDLRFFKEITVTASSEKMNAVVMGRKTWESIPTKYRPLPGRLNVVLTTRGGSYDIVTSEDVVKCGSLPTALNFLAESSISSKIERVFVIGGGEVLREALNAPECEAIHMTKIESNIECDTFIPPVDLSAFQPWYSSSTLVENDISFRFVTYVRMNRSIIGNSDEEDLTFLPQMILERKIMSMGI